MTTMLDPDVLTPQQRSVWECQQRGLRAPAIARETGIAVHNIYSIFCQLRHLESIGGRRTAQEAIDREHEEAAEMSKLETCGRCGLRGEHVCLSGDAGARRSEMWAP